MALAPVPRPRVSAVGGRVESGLSDLVKAKSMLDQAKLSRLGSQERMSSYSKPLFSGLSETQKSGLARMVVRGSSLSKVGEKKAGARLPAAITKAAEVFIPGALQLNAARELAVAVKEEVLAPKKVTELNAGEKAAFRAKAAMARLNARPYTLQEKAFINRAREASLNQARARMGQRK